MYVIPSVMVQSYICYVTKPIVEAELSKLCDFSLCVCVCVWRVTERSQGKGQSFDSSNTAYMKDGNSDQEKVSDWSPLSSHKASGDLELKTSSLKVMNYPSGRICQQNKTVLPIC